MTIFNTVAALQAATLTAGQIVRTKGYTAAGDGGHGDYLTVAGDSSNGLDKLLLGNGNTAELMNPEIADIRAFGIIGDGVTDDTAKIQGVINLGFPVLNTGDVRLVFKVSRLTGRGNIKITGNGTFDFSSNADYAATFSDPLIPFIGTAGSAILLTADANNEDLTLTVASTADLSEGDIVELATPTDNGGFMDTSIVVANGELFEVLSIDSGTQITLTTHVMDLNGYTVVNGAQIRKITTLDNITIGKDITIKGKGRDAADVSGDIGLFFQFCRNVKVHCNLDGVDARGVFFSSCYEYKATHMRVTTNVESANTKVNYGVSPADSSKFGEIAYNEFHNMRHAVVSSHLGGLLANTYGVSRMTNVHHNKSYNTWHAAYATHQDAELIFFDHNEATDCTFGVNIRERRMKARNNKLVNCGQDIYLTGEPTKCLIQGNEGYGGGYLLTVSFATSFDMDDMSIVGNRKFGGIGGISLICPTAVTSNKNLLLIDNEILGIDGAGGNDAGIRVEGHLLRPVINRNTVNGVSNGVGIRVIAVTSITDGEINGNVVREVSGRAYQFSANYVNVYAKYNSAKGFGGSFMSGSGNLANSSTVLSDNTDMGA